MAAVARPSFTLVNIGAASGPRRESIASAWQDWAGEPLTALTWDEVLAEPEAFADRLGPDSFVRLDSPDQDERARAALYRLGEAEAEAAGVRVLLEEDVADLQYGEIGSPTQLALGIVAAATLIEKQARERGASISILPDDLNCSFDKTACNARLAAAGIPVPQYLPIDGTFMGVVQAVLQSRNKRVFVKARHGAAAAGMMALANDGNGAGKTGRWTATTTALTGVDGKPFATRAIRQIRSVAEINQLITALAPLGLHVEQWLPKMGMNGRTIDLRLVVIGGEHVYPVVRASRHPITNLHIGGERYPADALIAHMGEGPWQALLDTARQTARLFPSAHCLGIDMAVLVDGKRHSVIEVNAFGDHVRDFTDDGLSLHGVLIRHIAERMERVRVA